MLSDDHMTDGRTDGRKDRQVDVNTKKHIRKHIYLHKSIISILNPLTIKYVNLKEAQRENSIMG